MQLEIDLYADEMFVDISFIWQEHLPLYFTPSFLESDRDVSELKSLETIIGGTKRQGENIETKYNKKTKTIQN